MTSANCAKCGLPLQAVYMVDGEGMKHPGCTSMPPGQVSRQESFAFDLNDNVLIKEIGRPGAVEALMIDFLGVQYRVAYWDNSDRRTVWLKQDELQSFPK